MWVCSLVLFIILWDGMCLGSLSNRQVNGYHFVPNAEFPPGLQNQTSSEKNMLHFHKCRDGGEAYSAAYLIDKRHLISHNTDYNLTWVNCEMASFIMMSSARDLNKEKHGQVIQTLDVLDFSIIHLSAYERLLRRHWRAIKSSSSNIDVIKNTGATLKRLALENRTEEMPGKTLKNRRRTIAIMPFLGTDMGSGHSNLRNRYHYLHACFWSVYYYFPNIVIGVKSQSDVDYIRNTAKFPVYDVILLPNLPKSAGLPVGLVQAAKEKFLNKVWDFDYIYYTESDQVLIARSVDNLYDQVSTHPRRIILPHRLMPYPEEVLQSYKRRPLVSENHSITSNLHFTENTQWRGTKCCLQRQNCVDRKQWAHISQPQIPIVKIHDLNVALGNANFHKEEYRGCRLMEETEQHTMRIVTAEADLENTVEVPYNSMYSSTNSLKHFCP